MDPTVVVDHQDVRAVDLHQMHGARRQVVNGAYDFAPHGG
jgi:hypothetical protein